MSKIISLQQFNDYTNNYEENTLKQIYIDSAEEVVFDYLGFSPLIQDYDLYVSGVGDFKQYLPARDIEGINLLEVDGKEIDVLNISFKEDYLFTNDRTKIFTVGDENIHIQFTAGFRKMPDIIPLTILRIASLMLTEAGGNIGLTGKSFLDQSRTFVNYTNYKKYLEPLDKLRLIKF